MVIYWPMAYFDPERASSSDWDSFLIKTMVQLGHTLVLCVPIPSKGVSDKVRQEYKRKRKDGQYLGKVVIRRFSMFKEPGNYFFRFIRYILCDIFQYLYGCRSNCELIYGDSTPPTHGLMLALLGNRLNVPVVFSLQDIFPDSLSLYGLIKKDGVLWRIGRKIEDYTYKNTDRIITLSADIQRNICAKGVPVTKTDVIYMGVDTDKVKPVPRKDNSLFDEYGFDRKAFYITYAGSLGPTQDIGLLLDAAEMLINNSEIRFIIFGNGSEKEALTSRIRKMDNVRIFSLMPPERLSEVYSLGDMSLIIARKGAGSSAMPSKTWNIMAAGTPVLLSFDKNSELWNIIEKYSCGICAEAGNASALAEGIITAFDNQSELKGMSNEARRFALNHASYTANANRYVNVISEMNS